MKAYEVRDTPCCMCPAVYSDFKKDICEKCNFIAVWQDDRGWVYWVKAGIAGTYKGFYAKTIEDYRNNVRQNGIKGLEYKSKFCYAQEDLNWLAKKKRWRVLDESNKNNN